jgi:hypothetical protein
MEAGKLSSDSLDAVKLSPDSTEAGKVSPESMEARKLFRPVNLLAYPGVRGNHTSFNSFHYILFT